MSITLLPEQEHFAVCFTGHRPEKLPDGNLLHLLQSLLFTEVRAAVSQGADTFYCGMARGADLWAADAILYFKQQNPGLRLICAVPFPEHGKGLRGEERYHYLSILHAADDVVCVSPVYSCDCYRKRNAYMIGHSRRLIALVADMQSGTGQTIRMAERAGLEIRRISIEAARVHKPTHSFFI